MFENFPRFFAFGPPVIRRPIGERGQIEPSLPDESLPVPHDGVHLRAFDDFLRAALSVTGHAVFQSYANRFITRTWGKFNHRFGGAQRRYNSPVIRPADAG